MSGVLLWSGVGALGGAGAVARYLVDRLVSARAGARYPAGILAVNLSGSALLGLLAGVALRGDALLLAGTALLGSYTTFSTWMLDCLRLREADRRVAAAANLAGSLVLGLAAIALGRALGGAL
jgi:fluoride exporter